MCGIFCEIIFGESVVVKDKEVIERIKNRGPDSYRSIEITLLSGIKITFAGSVLWMQGRNIVPQPCENDYAILLYNGDIFDDSWDTNLSDTEILMDKLCTKNGKKLSENEIIEVFKSLKGPFSIIFYDKSSQKLYVTRDRIGRNSLLLHRNDNSLVVSSVLDKGYKCFDLSAKYIHILDLANSTIKLYCLNGKISEMMLEHWMSNLQDLHYQSIEEFDPDSGFYIDFEKNDLIEYMKKVSIENTDKLTIMKKLMHNPTVSEIVKKITSLLSKSVEMRLNRQPMKCKKCLKIEIDMCNHCTVGILFSGGLDCTILALLANKYLPPDQSIDLINVAFKKDNNKSYDVPDRITGMQSLEELQEVCPLRNWVFKEVNIPKDEMKKYQECRIADLIHPRQTILDESLGTALWFAARCQDDNTISTCRILLLGSGADELFGGYMRHRNAFRRHGWIGLSQELLLDWRRISYRNLARDNRVICDHGRQPRLPYLDDYFTDYVLKLEPWLKCFPSEHLGLGIGDKLMLRLVAYNLGLENVAVLPKRALQFGSRIANKKDNGGDISRIFLKK